MYSVCIIPLNKQNMRVEGPNSISPEVYVLLHMGRLCDMNLMLHLFFELGSQDKHHYSYLTNEGLRLIVRKSLFIYHTIYNFQSFEPRSSYSSSSPVPRNSLETKGAAGLSQQEACHVHIPLDPYNTLTSLP